MSRLAIPRRTVLAGLGATVLTPALTRRARAAGDLVAAIYPAAWEDAYVGVVKPAVKARHDINVNFASRSAVFASADWTRYNDQVVAGTALSGVLTYAAGTNALSGTLTTANGSLSGPAVGQFYGPAAEELGGAFSLTSTTTSQDHVVGGFGAKR